MKYTVFFLMFLASIFNVYSQESLGVHDEIFEELKNEKEFAQKNNIKSVHEYVFKDSKKQDSILLESKEYSIKNNITSRINRYFTDTKNSRTTIYEYDSLNHIKQIKTTFSENSYISLYKFRFNESGERIELYYDFGTKNDLELQKYVYSLHSDGRFNSKQFNQELFSLVYYIYNSKNQLVKVSYVKNDTEPSIFYDDNGNVSIIKMISGAKYVYKYDDKGSLIEEYFQDEYSKVKNHIKRSYKYNDNDKPTEINVFNGSGKLKFRNALEYNEKNLLIKLVSYNKKGSINHTLKYYYTYYN